MKRYTYFLVFTLPLIVFFSIQQDGLYSFTALFVFFVALPLLELNISPNTTNFDRATSRIEKNKTVYDIALYLAVPVHYFVLFYFLNTIETSSFLSLGYFGKITAMGLCCGVMGLNVGHELGHRNHRFVQFLGELLLLSSLDSHFLPYHNAGHHYKVATPEDPATARKNESVYAFWFRSHFSSYTMAWNLEFKRMERLGKRKYSIGNRMVVYSISNVVLLTLIYYLFGNHALLAFLLSAAFGIALLETVNYIEHYGLLRKKTNGRYERPNPSHSWDSDHPIGRLYLFNLSRHSDHHKNGSKKYQLLNSNTESPKMPTGYPGMMLLALIPPLWKRVMNKKLR